MKENMETLVFLAQQGDQEAVTELYHLTYEKTYRAIRAMVQDDDTALDVLQDTYLKAFQSLDTLANPEKFPAWLQTIALNKARDQLRKRSDILFSQMADEDGQEPEFEDLSPWNHPEAVVDRQDTKKLLDKILSSLSVEQREAIVLFYYRELPEKEIASIQGCSVNTVKTRLRAGRKRIESAVLKLQKQEGIRLYSMAPIPFFLWLLRGALDQGLSLEELGVSATTGAAAAGTTAAGGTSAGAAGIAVGKVVAEKVIAGILVATVIGGAGIIAMNHLRGEPPAPPQPTIYTQATEPVEETESQTMAHAVYDEFLDRYKTSLDMDYASFQEAYNQFYTELIPYVAARHPEIDPSQEDFSVSYSPETGFGEGIPVPDTLYDPNMNSMFLTIFLRQNNEKLVRAYYDADGDGIDEMFIGKFYGEELAEEQIDVYTLRDGALIRGAVEAEGQTWTLKPAQESVFCQLYSDYPNFLYIQLGEEVFSGNDRIEKPELEWEAFCDYPSGGQYDESFDPFSMILG